MVGCWSSITEDDQKISLYLFHHTRIGQWSGERYAKFHQHPLAGEQLLCFQMLDHLAVPSYVECVRGMAAAFELQEIMHGEVSRVISFKTDATNVVQYFCPCHFKSNTHAPEAFHATPHFRPFTGPGQLRRFTAMVTHFPMSTYLLVVNISMYLSKSTYERL